MLVACAIDNAGGRRTGDTLYDQAYVVAAHRGVVVVRHHVDCSQRGSRASILAQYWVVDLSLQVSQCPRPLSVEDLAVLRSNSNCTRSFCQKRVPEQAPRTRMPSGCAGQGT